MVIDCDLQHPPEKIVEMYHLWQEGYEVIEGVKTAAEARRVLCIPLRHPVFMG